MERSAQLFKNCLFGLFLLTCWNWAVQSHNSLLSSAQAQEWVSSRVYGTFACWGTFDLTSVEEELQFLPLISQELTDALNLPATEEWVELYVFSDESQWKEFLQREYPQIPYRRALFLKKKKGRGQLFLHRSENFAADVRHEGTHAFLHAVLPEVPIWLDEGLAEYFEVSPLSEEDSRNARIRGADWFPQISERAQKNQIAKLGELEQLHDMDEMTSVRYADSWAWVCFLLNGPEEVRMLLPLYTSELIKKKSLAMFPVTPISRRLLKLYPDPNVELDRFLKKVLPQKGFSKVIRRAPPHPIEKPDF